MVTKLRSVDELIIPPADKTFISFKFFFSNVIYRFSLIFILYFDLTFILFGKTRIQLTRLRDFRFEENLKKFLKWPSENIIIYSDPTPIVQESRSYRLLYIWCLVPSTSAIHMLSSLFYDAIIVLFQ